MTAGCEVYTHVTFNEALTIADAYGISDNYGGEILWVNRSLFLDSTQYSEKMVITPGTTFSDIEQSWIQRRKSSPERRELELEQSEYEINLKEVRRRYQHYEKELESYIRKQPSRESNKEVVINTIRSRLAYLKEQIHQFEGESARIRLEIDDLDRINDSAYGKSIRLDQMLVKLPFYRRIKGEDKILRVEGYSKAAAENKFFPDPNAYYF